MNKIAIAGAALSFAFLACSENSSGSEENHGDVVKNRVSSLTTGQCLGNDFDSFALLKKGDSEELDKAYLIQEPDSCQIMIPNLSDYCDIVADFYSSRLGDTLEIWYGGDRIAFSNCDCRKDHWFEIACADADAKYFKYQSGIFRVVDEPAPISELDSAILGPQAPTFDESDPHQKGADIIGWCPSGSKNDETLWNHEILYLDNRGMFENNEEDKTSPVARTYEVKEGYITFVLEGVMSCDDHLSEVNVFPHGDTLYVETGTEPNEVKTLKENEGCICTTRFTFTIKADKEYANATHLVMDGGMSWVYTILEGSTPQSSAE